MPTAGYTDGIHNQKVAVSTASAHSNISLNLNLGDNCLEMNEIKMEMKGVSYGGVIPKGIGNLYQHNQQCYKALLQQLKDDLSKEVKGIIENEVNESLNELK